MKKVKGLTFLCPFFFARSDVPSPSLSARFPHNPILHYAYSSLFKENKAETIATGKDGGCTFYHNTLRT